MIFFMNLFSYSRLLVRHHWFVLNFVVLFSIVLTIVGLGFTQLPDFSDPRKVNQCKRLFRRERICAFLVFFSVKRDGVLVAKAQYSLN